MLRIKETLSDKTYLKYSIFVIFTAAILYLLYFFVKNIHSITTAGATLASQVTTALSPLFIGLILAYLLSPLALVIDRKIIQKLLPEKIADSSKTQKRRNLRKLLSVLATYLLVLAVIIISIYTFATLIVGKFIFAGLTTAFSEVSNSIKGYEESILQWFSNFNSPNFSKAANEAVQKAFSWLSSHFSGSSMFGFAKSFVGGVFNLVIGFVISIYILMDPVFFKGLWNNFIRLVFPPKIGVRINETLNDVNSIFSNFIRGALLDSLIVAIISSIALSLMGLKFAVFVGCFAGICNIIPYFGPVLGMVPAFIIGTFTENIWHGLLAVLLLQIVQQVDANFIYPKIVGSKTGLHPLFILVAVTFAGHFFGILGMLLAVPAAGIIQLFVLKWAKKRDAALAPKSEGAPPEN